MLNQVQVSAYPSASLPDLASGVPWLGGKTGEGIVSELHGKWYSAAYRGNVFMLNTAAAGTTIPIQATNLVSTFTLWNPLGSGKNIELIRYTLALEAATTVVSDVSLYFQPGIGTGFNAAPGTLTALTIRSALLNSGASASVATGYSAATLVNTVGTNMFVGPILTGFGAVTTNVATPINYEFDGSIIVPPGCLITTAGTAAQVSATRQSLIWAEWPI